MGEMVKRSRYAGWLGGLFSRSEQMQATKEFLLQADNVILANGGAIMHRPGILAYGNTMPAYIIGLFCNPSVYCATQDKKLLRQVGTVLLNTYANGGRGQFIKFEDKLVHSNGRDTMQVWTEVAVTTSSAFGSPPLTRILLVHNDRVFGAVGTTLYETAPGRAPDAAVDYWATGASWAINTGSGKPITALGSLGRQGLLIFNRSEIWLQTGYTKQERQTRLLTGEYGCIAPDSVQTVDLAGVGQCVVFLSSAKQLCAATANGVIEIGENVQAELDEVWEGAVVDDVTPTNEVKHRAVSAFHPDGYYLLGYATANTDSEAVWTRCLCLHTKMRGEGGGLWPITRWCPTGDAQVFPITFGAMATVYDTARTSVMIGQKQLDNLYQPFMVRTDLENDSDPFKAGGAALYQIPWRMRTIDDDLGDDLALKTFMEVVLDVARTAAGTVTFSFDQILESDTYEQTAQNVAIAVATANKVYRGTVTMTNTGQRFSLVLRSYVAGMPQNKGYRLNGLEIRYLPAGLP